MKRRLLLEWLVIMNIMWITVERGFPREPVQVTSPDGNISLSFELKANPQPYLPGERPYYRVSYKGVPILADSPLGLDLKGASPLDHGFEIVGTAPQTHDETWQNAFGTRRNVRDHYNQITISLRESASPGRRLDLIFRAYNEGVAFRYSLPKQQSLDEFVISSEFTGFYFPKSVFAYALDLDSYTTPYEASFERMSLDKIKPASIIGLPLLVEIPQGPWVALLESDLRDYAGMYVGGVHGVPNALTAKLSPLPDLDLWSMGTYLNFVNTETDFDKAVQLAQGALLISSHRRIDQRGSEDIVLARTPKATPWRVLMINPTPGGLIESNYLILNLSQPCALADTSWIKPGKAAWDWWSGRFARDVDFQPGMNTATLNHYIDFAADHHFEYMMIDSNWSPFNDITRTIPEVDLPAVLAHARSRGVKVLLWMLWTAVRQQMDVAFPLYEKWGVAGVKIDFMDRDDQAMVNFYEEMARKAAEHHLLVDFHGAFKPTGLRRTYPNMVGREGVMGLEYNKGSYRVTPEHEVTIPFTRMLGGPMDFTSGCFHNATREQFKPRNIEPMCQGTRAHQLAMYAVYEVPLAMVSDYPEAYKNQPEFEFIERVPTVWDDTKVLNGMPGKYITIARQHGDTWYLGSMTNWETRDMQVAVDFLGEGEYEAKVFADGPDADKVPTSVSISNKRVKRGDKLNAHLAPGGGCAVIFTPVRH